MALLTCGSYKNQPYSLALVAASLYPNWNYKVILSLFL